MMTITKRINKTDWMLYSVSVLLGVSIVLSNYYVNTMDETRQNDVGRYLENIISRMDAVSGQLSAWGTIDVRKELGRY